MAMPMCATGDGQPATAICTILSTGEASTLCDEHLVMWCAAMLQAMTGVDATPFILAMSQPDEVPETAEGTATDEPPPPAPADTDDDAGWAASRVTASEAQEKAGEGPSLTGGPGGPSLNGWRSVAALTGGSNVDD